jgi:hypothetical protein
MLIFVLTILAACDGDSITGSSGDPLEPEEATAVLAVISELLGGAFIGIPGPATSSPALMIGEIPVSESFTVSESCPLGGSVGVSGVITGDVAEDGNSGTFDFDFTETISGCGIQHGGTQFIVNGAPNLKLGGSIAIVVHSSSSFTWNGSISLRGGFSYTSSDDRAGTCGVDVKYKYSGTSVSWNGRVCGHTSSGSVGLSL